MIEQTLIARKRREETKTTCHYLYKLRLKGMDKPLNRLHTRTEKSAKGQQGWTKYLKVTDKIIKAKKKELADLEELRKSLDAL